MEGSALPQTCAPVTPDTVVRNNIMSLLYSGHPWDVRECPDLGVLMRGYRDRFVVGKCVLFIEVSSFQGS